MILNNENILIQKRVRDLIEELSTGVSDFAEKIGTHQSTLSRALSPTNTFGDGLINKIVIAFDINRDWIKHGTGSKFSADDPRPADEDDTQHDAKANYKLIPLYSLDVVGGLNNEECGTMGYVMGYMPFVNAKEEDISVVVTGNSMYPTYPAGSYIQIRKLTYWKEYIEFGQVHIIELMDDRRLIKEVRKGSDRNHFRLISHNNNFDETEVSIDFIRSVWLVLAKFEKAVM